jgi:hypothetical protein
MSGTALCDHIEKNMSVIRKSIWNLCALLGVAFICILIFWIGAHLFFYFGPDDSMVFFVRLLHLGPLLTLIYVASLTIAFIFTWRIAFQKDKNDCLLLPVTQFISVAFLLFTGTLLLASSSMYASVSSGPGDGGELAQCQLFDIATLLVAWIIYGTILLSLKHLNKEK